MKPEELNKLEKFEEQCSAYVLGALEPEECRVFEQYLETASADRLRQLEEYQNVVKQLPAAIEPEAPTAELKDKILSQVQKQQKQSSTEQSQTVTQKEKSGDLLERLAVTLHIDEPRMAAAAVLALFIILLSIIPYGLQLRRQISQQEQQLQARTRQMAELQTEVEQKEDLLKVLGSRDIKVAIMSGQNDTQTRYGKIIWDPVEMQAILQVRNLPPLPDDYTYQLWLTRDGKTQSAGTFTFRDSDTEHFFKIEKLADRYEAANATFAVTMEPRGGVDKPTGQTYLIGKHQP